MKKNHPDYFLLIITLLLILFGVLILASVSAPISQEATGNSYYFFKHQILRGLIPGLILAFIAFRIDLLRFKKLIPLGLLFNLILMAMVFLPGVGLESDGAARWLKFGPISFQPSEFLKLSFILYLASWLESRRQKAKAKNFSNTFLAFLTVILIISSLLIFQPNVSTLGIIVLVAAGMYFVAELPLWHTSLMIVLGISSLLILMKITSYRSNRLLVFLNPGFDPMGIGYQLKQAIIAIGSGGIFGWGLGMGFQKLGFLPQPMADAIFAVFSEETGFVGGAMLILLFLLFLWRGFKIARESQNIFFKLTALGICSWIIIQTFVNIGAMIGILPLTGIPLPFISYGSSALVAELIGIGILLNISRQKTS